MTDPVVGQTYQTSGGPVVLLALTPYQAQVQPANGDDPLWIQRSALGDHVVDQSEDPSIEDLIHAAMQLLEVARARLALGEK
jgi:hypothetical protein